MSTLVSVGLHLLVILILLAPVLGPRVLEEVQGGGGEGPAGGGGGGTRGLGGNSGIGVVERLHYMQVTPAVVAPLPAVVTPPVAPVVPPPTPAPVTPPVVPPPPSPPAAAPSQDAPVASAAPSATSGTGGGTGADGTAGSGPGSGGGVGSGVGTGRGTGSGPGTGGGPNTVYPPQLTELFLPPWPIPDKVKGTQIVAEFDVDSLGHVLKVDFTPTRDGGYNRKLRDVLAAVRFKPAVRGDGQPVRAKGSFTYLF